MKKWIAILGLPLLLTGCGGLEGNWEKVSGSNCLAKTISFVDEKNFSISGGGSASGTYEELDDDKYKFKIGPFSKIYEVTEDDGKLMMKPVTGDQGTCIYKEVGSE
ncbi:hypothetical protein [Melghirimyces algeriensis]|uniref:Lipoprotein n=1 Tax=Melghirimyces algeriensis TaxID=910412 RepID=A0A521FEI4_9BACL|nr:hypothetical protein [Melghirimyces algeriensis]SMO94519.1 hypothetical protein SAMN06264849_11749 [Melghirimyces algeriensis]